MTVQNAVVHLLDGGDVFGHVASVAVTVDAETAHVVPPGNTVLTGRSVFKAVVVQNQTKKSYNNFSSENSYTLNFT